MAEKDDYLADVLVDLGIVNADQVTQTRREAEASGRFGRKIVTEVDALSEFYVAEEYHQRYLEKRGLATCRI